MTTEQAGGCVGCEQPIVDGERSVATIVIRQDRTEQARMHPECLALPIVGHQFGVCSCTGFDTSRASALELHDRMVAAQGW